MLASSFRYLLTLVFLAVTASSACAIDLTVDSQPQASVSDLVDIEQGAQLPLLDGVGWVFGIPKKIILWDRRADNHEVSTETIEETAEYLIENHVDGVKVRVNQYDPIGEWKRLAKNDRVGFGWRATVGSIYTLGYSVVPGRLFGNDWYNPYTDSVHVYSDIPSLAMEQAAHAKDVHDRTHPGFYSAMQLVPFVGIVHEARSKQSVFDYVDKHGTIEQRAEARRVLHPQLGSEVGGQMATFIPQGDAMFQLTGAVVGHVVGRYQASRISSEVPIVLPEQGQQEPLTSANNPKTPSPYAQLLEADSKPLFTSPPVVDAQVSAESMPSLLGPMNGQPTEANPWLFTPQD